MQWSAVRVEIIGRLFPSLERPGTWQLAGDRHDRNAEGTLVASLQVTRELAVGDLLELEGQTCQTWIRGRIEFLGVYFFRTYSGHVEALESLSRRDARVRQVRS